MNIYWGDLHNHCEISYGFGSLDNALKVAASQLDFCGITGHAMWPDMHEANEDTVSIVDFHNRGFRKFESNWEKVREAVNTANREGEFVTYQSYEMHSSLYGDYHIVSPDSNLSLINGQCPKELVKNCGTRSIAIPHHIGYTPGYRGINWDLFDEEISPVIEVFSKHGCAMSEYADYPYYHDMGPRDSKNTIYKGLERGLCFGFVGSTDHHAGYPGSYGDGKLAVLADSKTREGIWEALINRRTYAVTGDKIKCSFVVNGAPFGSVIENTGKCEIYLDVVGSYHIDKIIIFKNLKPFWVTTGEQLKNKGAGHYKLRIEMGWGNSPVPYVWDGSVRVLDGVFCGVETCFRGKSVISPMSGEIDNTDINKFENLITMNTNSAIEWRIETYKNQSTLHPQTSSVILDVQGTPSTLAVFDINGIKEKRTIGELIAAGFSRHVKPYASQAFKVHSAIPDNYYSCQVILENKEVCNGDFYHAEIKQYNGQAAYISPVFIR